LLNLTRDNVQLLVNGIWELPTERLDEHIVAKLPKPSFALPRARKLPEPKQLTKWEAFAKTKGIKKRVKDKKVYDTELDKWVPTYGYQAFKADKEKNWVLEVPQNIDPMTDMFQKKKDLKNERVAKNEIARMKNIARAQKVQIPRAGFVSDPLKNFTLQPLSPKLRQLRWANSKTSYRERRKPVVSESRSSSQAQNESAPWTQKWKNRNKSMWLRRFSTNGPRSTSTKPFRCRREKPAKSK
jgi:Ribosome biogenesis regulatory protein (RRS1)